MEAVNQVIRRELHSDVTLIKQIAEYIISAGGKRIRPALVLLFANACGYRGHHHHTLAAIIEVVQTSPLLHDDVVDESTLRRGQPTSNAMFGNAASVLVGDFLYSRAFQMLVSVDNMRVMDVLADATNIIAEGEVLQLMNMRDPEVTEERYRQIIHAKTAKLFEASACIGALIGGATDEQFAAAAECGHGLGMAFQLVDDMLDYTGSLEQIGKNLGDDLREGKMTLPLIHLMRHGTEQQRQLVRNSIRHGDENNFDAILAAIAACGGLDYTKRQADKAAAAAAAALIHFTDSQFKESLLKLCAFAAARKY
ncbi:MAG: polyprenyl synthetase family protein [Burkholderiaceae bacterium]|nr:polyprenyl synthetase family protein [Burkholderiaceae bacterium]